MIPAEFFLKACLEISLLAFIVYRLLLLAQETRAYRLIKGLLLIAFIWWLALKFDLGVLKVILKGVDLGTVMVIAVLVLFTPEIKAALARIGVDYAGAWALEPWRFAIRGDPHVSKQPKRSTRQ